MNTITRHRGFTLIELLVVITIIVLVSLGVVPTVRKLLKAQTGAQAASLFSAQLSSARAEAIMSGNYTALHSQLSDRDDTKDQCFLAVLSYQALNPTSQIRGLAMAPGHVPLQVPGNQAFGQLTSYTISGSSFKNIPQDIRRGFSMVTVMFDRQGQVTPLINQKNPRFVNVSSKGLFTSSATASGTALWQTKGGDPNNDADSFAYWPHLPGVTATCVYDYKKLSLLPEPPSTARGDYLNANARILPINSYTGSLFDMD